MDNDRGWSGFRERWRRVRQKLGCTPRIKTEGGPSRRKFDPVAHAGSWIVGETADKAGGLIAPPVGSYVGNEFDVRVIRPHVHLHVHTINASGRIGASFNYPEMIIVPRWREANGYAAVRLRV